MRKDSQQNKKAWEFNTYDFWNSRCTPQERARADLANPVGQLKKYALEVAEAAKVKIDYQVCDVLEIDRNIYANSYDIVFMEGGILHYFHDINQFMDIMYSLLKKGGKLICSDFHPYTKIQDTLGLEQKTMNYFSTDVFEGEMAHARFYDDNTRKKIPLCSYRKYTISEIINAVIQNGFTLERFDEFPSWENPDLPGEFALIGRK